ncbi:hypothetical protein M8J76_016963 [Diaphorina citri]|nr:hypothetical protein M8J75_015369 [Diaphorina citri]KAI5723004.1 hypothetical protein M8J76_016963 [Diaphorina citri]
MNTTGAGARRKPKYFEDLEEHGASTYHHINPQHVIDSMESCSSTTFVPPSSACPTTVFTVPPTTPSTAPPITPSTAPPSTPSTASPTTPSTAPPNTPSTAPLSIPITPGPSAASPHHPHLPIREERKNKTCY